jgi:hypothetical protein
MNLGVSGLLGNQVDFKPPLNLEAFIGGLKLCFFNEDIHS